MPVLLSKYAGPQRHTFLSLQTSLLCLVVDLPQGGSASNGVTPSSFYKDNYDIYLLQDSHTASQNEEQPEVGV